MNKPTQADVDAAWAALQPLYAAYAATLEAYALAQAAWMADVRRARNAPLGPAPARLARSAVALQAAYVPYRMAHATYQVAEHAYDVLRLRVELDGSN